MLSAKFTEFNDFTEDINSLLLTLTALVSAVFRQPITPTNITH